MSPAARPLAAQALVEAARAGLLDDPKPEERTFRDAVRDVGRPFLAALETNPDAGLDPGLAARLEAAFDDPAATAVPGLKDVKFGQAFAIVRIPQFGLKYARPVYEGTTRDVLMHGIGHYASTAMPGELGNFAVAGHRTTYGKPFNRIDDLRTGDVVIVETRQTWFVYRVSSTEVVAPSRSDVILPVPEQPGVEAGEALLTMTSCHPEFSSRERYVVHATLATTYPHAEDLPADLLTRRG